MTIKRNGPMRGPFHSGRLLAKKSTDTWELSYQAGQKARISIHGDGGTNLDVTVLDAEGKVVAEAKETTDRESVTWNVSRPGS